MSVLLIGCGRMGGALARGWRGLERVAAFDPAAPAIEGVERLQSVADAHTLPGPLTVVIAVKPQVLGEVLPDLAPLADAGALFISIAAGATLSSLQTALGPDALIVRTMPNTPTAIGRGITAAVASPSLAAQHRGRVTDLFSAVGEVVWLDDETQIDAVTALSGSGPAYFFRFTEALAAAGVAEGLPPATAMQLARATFLGAAALAGARAESLALLRQEVTSPGGTTAAALAKFDEDGAVDDLTRRAVAAAAARSRELSL